MSAPAASQRKQQDLQTQYGIYKNTLQQIAQKIGDVEQEAEEHKCVFSSFHSPAVLMRWFPLVFFTTAGSRGKATTSSGGVMNSPWSRVLVATHTAPHQDPP
ncbi:prefoldin subunit 2 [Colletotrichum chrysophilum]|uniref:Prefoldin subunit 2 n=1 Tax=Colletotrichum chrysophilum TaxID=1836956 RepID=A0AAD9A8F1_9PEZI|nr:prefoldin subunit 2 [Colletotrichum chrysophilum]